MERVTFGPFEFESRSTTLTRGGRKVSIGSRSAALLGVLIEAAGAVVSKGNLLERAWPGMTVEESNLTVQVAALRKALGRRTDNSEWIVTLPRVGYRLWTEDAEGVGSGPSITMSPLPLLAVLPFRNVSGDDTQQYFADGIVDDLITALSRFKTFAVTSLETSCVSRLSLLRRLPVDTSGHKPTMERWKTSLMCKIE